MIKYDIMCHYEDDQPGLVIREMGDREVGHITMSLDELRQHRHALDYYINTLELLEANLPPKIERGEGSIE